jgi:hypothetical protein
MVFALKATQLRGGHVNSRPGRKCLNNGFPSSDIARVVARREFCNPQASIGFGKARLGARTA